MDAPSMYRPTCLLNETRKLLDRITANRINRHSTQVGPDLSDTQYGFWVGHSTFEAIHRVTTLARSVTKCRIALAVSIDIVNVFHSLP